MQCNAALAITGAIDITSHQRRSIKNGVLRNFAKFTRKHLCQSFFFNKVAQLRPATLLKKRLTHAFSCEFCEISKNAFFIEHLWKIAFFREKIYQEVGSESGKTVVSKIWLLFEIFKKRITQLSCRYSS